MEDKTSLEFYARKILPEAQIRKFRYRADLLVKELELESKYPEVKNVLYDVFNAVKERDYSKYLISHKQLGGRVSESSLYWMILRQLLVQMKIETQEQKDVIEKINKRGWELDIKEMKVLENLHKQEKRLTKRESELLRFYAQGKSLMEMF